jgi:hypothetical protein
MISLLFLGAFHNDEAFTPLCGLASALGSLAKPSPFSLFFRSLPTPVQKNDVHPSFSDT